MPYNHGEDPNASSAAASSRSYSSTGESPMEALGIAATATHEQLHSEFLRDRDGNPSGGHTFGRGIQITWQHGPLGRRPTRSYPNGAFVEDVIQAAIERLRFYNESTFACRENSLAITKLEEALHWLKARTEDREKRGVEGTHEV